MLLSLALTPQGDGLMQKKFNTHQIQLWNGSHSHFSQIPQLSMVASNIVHLACD